MKRFTGTEKWDKPWFRRLPPKLKCLWFYIVDRCDCAGIWDADWETASHFIGEPVSLEDTIPFENRLETLGDSGKLWVTEFCKFQYGALVESCKPHAGVIFRLQALGLYGRVIKGLPNPTGKGKGKGKGGIGGEKKLMPPSDDELNLHAAKLGLPENEVAKFKAYYESNGWRVGKNPMKSWRGAMAGWKTRWEERRGQLPFPANPQPYGPPPHNGRNPAIAKELLAKEAGGQPLTNRERQLVIFHSGVCE